MGPLETCAWCQAVDLGAPLDDDAAELADLWWARGVLEVLAEAGHELECNDGIGVVIDRPDDLLRVPRRADLASRVAGFEQPDELRPSLVIEAFISLGEQPSRSVEGVVLVPAVTEGLVLDPPATSSRRWFASFTRWNGSATWVASGSSVINPPT